MYVLCQDGQGGRADKAGLAVGANPVQAALFEIVDCRLDGGVLLVRLGEIDLHFDGTAACGQASLGGHGIEFQDVAEGDPVGRLWKPRSKLQARSSGKRFRVGSMRGTAASVSPPCHRIRCSRTNWC